MERELSHSESDREELYTDFLYNGITIEDLEKIVYDKHNIKPGDVHNLIFSYMVYLEFLEFYLKNAPYLKYEDNDDFRDTIKINFGYLIDGRMKNNVEIEYNDTLIEEMGKYIEKYGNNKMYINMNLLLLLDKETTIIAAGKDEHSNYYKYENEGDEDALIDDGYWLVKNDIEHHTETIFDYYKVEGYATFEVYMEN